jgi:hypothetical protein
MHSNRFVCAGLFVYIAVFTPSLPALGQPLSGEPSVQQSPANGAANTAEQYVDEGNALEEKDDLLGAYDAYQAAWKLKRAYDIAGNLGVLELELRKWRDAAEHLAYCEQNYPAVRSEAQNKAFVKLQGLLKQARSKVGLARVRVAPENGSSAEGVEILVDSRPVGRASASGKLAHPLLQSNEVFVDAGSRTFTARKTGCEDGRVVMSVTKGSAVDVVLSPCKRKLSTPLIVGGTGLALAGIGFGIVATLYSNMKSNDAGAKSVMLVKQDDPSACNKSSNATLCTELDAAYKQSQIWQGLAIGGFAVGGAVATATIIYVVTGQSKPPLEPEAGVKLQGSFSPAPGGGVAVLRGVF